MINTQELMFKIIDSPTNPNLGYIVYIDPIASYYDITVQTVEKDSDGYDSGSKELKEDIITVEKLTIDEVITQIDSELIDLISKYDKQIHFESYIQLCEFHNFGEE